MLTRSKAKYGESLSKQDKISLIQYETWFMICVAVCMLLIVAIHSLKPSFRVLILNDQPLAYSAIEVNYLGISNRYYLAADKESWLPWLPHQVKPSYLRDISNLTDQISIPLSWTQIPKITQFLNQNFTYDFLGWFGHNEATFVETISNHILADQHSLNRLSCASFIGIKLGGFCILDIVNSWYTYISYMPLAISFMVSLMVFI